MLSLNMSLKINHTLFPTHDPSSNTTADVIRNGFSRKSESRCTSSRNAAPPAVGWESGANDNFPRATYPCQALRTSKPRGGSLPVSSNLIPTMQPTCTVTVTRRSHAAYRSSIRLPRYRLDKLDICSRTRLAASEAQLQREKDPSGHTWAVEYCVF
jgi:hypothetical protein